ncbi:MAG: hypothetical protein WDO13_01200 [Verrucomicrobiota bacterium]
MRRYSLFLAAALGLAGFGAASAIDINPSKNNQPDSFWESGGGNRFSIFKRRPEAHPAGQRRGPEGL